MSAQSVLDGLYLFNQSPSHRGYTLVEFQHYFLVFPVLHQKARFFYEDGKPIGLVTWCWLTEEEKRQTVLGWAELIAPSFVEENEQAVAQKLQSKLAEPVRSSVSVL